MSSALIASALVWGLQQGIRWNEPLRWSMLTESAAGAFVYAIVGSVPFIGLVLLCEHMADRLNAR